MRNNLHWQPRMLLRHQGHCLAASTLRHARESSTGETEWLESGARSSTALAMRERRRSRGQLPAGREAPWREIRVVPSCEDRLCPPLPLEQAPLALMAAPRPVFCVTFAPLRYFCAPFVNPLSRRRDTSSPGIPNPQRRDASLDESGSLHFVRTARAPRAWNERGRARNQSRRPRMGSAAAGRHSAPFLTAVLSATRICLNELDFGSSVYRLEPNVMNVNRLNSHSQSTTLTPGAIAPDLSQTHVLGSGPNSLKVHMSIPCWHLSHILHAPIRRE
jgi:hypothetical protein